MSAPKTLTAALLAALAIPTAASATFFTESFEAPEAASPYTLNGDDFDASEFDFFGRFDDWNSGGSNRARDDFSGVDGSFAIGGQDHDGAGGSALRTLTVGNIDITGQNGVLVTVAVGALASEPAFQNYESTDGLAIFATVDNGTRSLIGQFRNDGADGDLFEDTDLDGVGDGTLLTAELADFSFAVLETGSSLSLDFEFFSDNSFEPTVVDNVRVGVIPEPTSLLIFGTATGVLALRRRRSA